MNRSKIQHFRNRLLTPIQYVKGVGPRLAKLFEKKGIQTVEDGLYFLPRCYEDRRHLQKISELKAGKKETGFGEILLSGTAFYQNRKRRAFYADSEAPSPTPRRRLVTPMVYGYSDELSSPIPEEIVERQALIDFSEAFPRGHFPPQGESLEKLNLPPSDRHL